MGMSTAKFVKTETRPGPGTGRTTNYHFCTMPWDALCLVDVLCPTF